MRAAPRASGFPHGRADSDQYRQHGPYSVFLRTIAIHRKLHCRLWRTATQNLRCHLRQADAHLIAASSASIHPQVLLYLSKSLQQHAYSRQCAWIVKTSSHSNRPFVRNPDPDTVKRARACTALLGIGKEILTRPKEDGWGTRIIERLAKDLRSEFPDMQGLSPRNLGYMKAFAEAWPQQPIFATVAKLPWGHNMRSGRAISLHSTRRKLKAIADCEIGPGSEVSADNFTAVVERARGKRLR